MASYLLIAAYNHAGKVRSSTGATLRATDAWHAVPRYVGIYHQELVRLFSERKDPVIVGMVAGGGVATYPANHAIPHQDRVQRILPGLTDRLRFKDYATWHPQFACLVWLDMDCAVVHAVACQNPGESTVAYSDSGDISVVDRESVSLSCNASKNARLLLRRWSERSCWENEDLHRTGWES
jgi:hypothetical protein